MKRMETITKKELCSGCGACVQKCPRQCIQMCADPDGFSYPQIDSSACTNCGWCRRVCPCRPESYHIGDRAEPEYFAVRLRDPALRSRSASGGAFRSLSDAILTAGGAVAGVRFDSDWQAELTVAEDAAGREAFCSSKYVQSRNRDAYRQTGALLKAGRRVLFSGTPCQVAGLYAFLGGDDPGLITVDLICHGVPSPLVFDEYRRELERRYGSRMTALNFRDKAGGWTPVYMTATFESGERYTAMHEADPYYRMFLGGWLSRLCCYGCPYTRAARREADLTLGDAWKAVTLHPEWCDNTGISAVMVHSAKGARLLAEAAADLECVACSLAEVDQRCLHAPGPRHPDREAFFRTLRRHGVAYAMACYRGPRPLWRRLQSRMRKIVRRAWYGWQFGTQAKEVKR